MLVSTFCAWGQDDWKKWATISNEKPALDYDTHCWTWISGKAVYLWGAVYVAKPGEKADFKVRVIKQKTEWADLHIAITNNIPTRQEQWRFVSNKEDANFSIRFVDSNEHFSVRFIPMSEWEHRHENHMGLPVVYGDN